MKSIKGVIFDLDNTLLDFMKMKEFAVKAAIKGMIEAGLEVNEKKSYEAVPLDTDNNDLNNKVEKDKYEYAETIVEEETLSLLEKEIEMIKRALSRSKGRRKLAAKELGISERTLYRKIKQFDLNKNINE